MEWSWTTWLISVAAVVGSGVTAWVEGNWKRRPGLAMGFVNHGGMWSDLVLLSIANAVLVPHLTPGPWIGGAILVSALASVWVHIHWYRHGRRLAEDPASPATTVECAEELSCSRLSAGDHMWPSRADGRWWKDLSWAGWAHVLYVTGELALLAGFLLLAMPPEVVILIALIFTIHVPIGLLQPRWYRNGHIATVAEQPLLAPLLVGLWAVTVFKLNQ